MAQDSHTLLIRHTNDLQLLLQSTRRTRFRVEFADLSGEENLELERRLRAAVSACGCSEGTYGLMLGMAFDIVAWMLLHPGLWALILVPLGLMTAGKLFGLWRGTQRLRRTIAEAIDFRIRSEHESRLPQQALRSGAV